MRNENIFALTCLMIFQCHGKFRAWIENHQTYSQTLFGENKRQVVCAQPENESM